MKQVVSVASAVFSEVQMIEQKQFKKDLQNGSVKIAFEGTFKEGIDFLTDTGICGRLY